MVMQLQNMKISKGYGRGRDRGGFGINKQQRVRRHSEKNNCTMRSEGDSMIRTQRELLTVGTSVCQYHDSQIGEPWNDDKRNKYMSNTSLKTNPKVLLMRPNNLNLRRVLKYIFDMTFTVKLDVHNGIIRDLLPVTKYLRILSTMDQ